MFIWCTTSHLLFPSFLPSGVIFVNVYLYSWIIVIWHLSSSSFSLFSLFLSHSFADRKCRIKVEASTESFFPFVFLFFVESIQSTDLTIILFYPSSSSFFYFLPLLLLLLLSWYSFTIQNLAPFFALTVSHTHNYNTIEERRKKNEKKEKKDEDEVALRCCCWLLLWWECSFTLLLVSEMFTWNIKVDTKYDKKKRRNK